MIGALIDIEGIVVRFSERLESVSVKIKRNIKKIRARKICVGSDF